MSSRECSPPASGSATADQLDSVIPRRESERATRLLGIVNLTPDSFHDGGTDPTVLASVERAEQLLAAGADALDLGAESTRPGADPVSAEEELDRLLPVLEGLEPLNATISVDTMKAEVAARTLAAGASMINDVTGLQHDPEIANACAEAGAGLVLMHMRGTPRTMKELTDYADVVGATLDFLRGARDQAIAAGVAADRILIDPGIGFAKTGDQSLAILGRIREYHALDCPILLGTSRKSFLRPFDGEDSDDRLEGTLATSALAVQAGVQVLRVHDVAANRRAVLVTEAILRAGGTPC